jgi:trans-AT polyketide synthase/acyltransferase/oxidoreductase domain-containing protein
MRAAEERAPRVSAEQLGSAEYRRDHRLRYAYAAGAMVHGIASEDLVVRMGRAGLLSFFGSGGLTLDRVERAIVDITRRLREGDPFGMNLLCNTVDPDKEWRTIELYLRRGIELVEASAFMTMTPALVLYRLRGARRLADGSVRTPHRIQAKVSRPEVGRQFLAPPPPRIVAALVDRGELSRGEAELAPGIAMADDICVEADSGGHTDNGQALALMPTFLALRDEASRAHRLPKRVRIGAAGGIGTPHAIAAAFVLGADFVLTGSINQCTVEAGTSDLVKDMLQQAGVQDTEMAPAGDMFEIGARVQVLKKGTFFATRANRLYDLFKHHRSLEEIDPQVLTQLETTCFKKPLADVRQETVEHLRRTNPRELEKMESNPKHAMVRVFKWYFGQASRAAQAGRAEDRANFQVHCGPAMGAFNAWVKGTPYEDWRNRHVDAIAELLMRGAADVLDATLQQFTASPAEPLEVAV